MRAPRPNNPLQGFTAGSPAALRSARPRSQQREDSGNRGDQQIDALLPSGSELLLPRTGVRPQWI